MRLGLALLVCFLATCKRPEEERGACVVKMGAGMQCVYVTEKVCGIAIERGVTCQELGYTRSMGPESWAKPVFGACITRPSFGPALCKSNVAIEDCPEGVYPDRTCEDVADKWRGDRPPPGRGTFELALAAGVPQAREVAVRSGAELTAEVTHTSGGLGKITLAVHDARHPAVPISSDDITCAEPGCSMRTVVAVGDGTETLVVTVEATEALTARLAIHD